MDIPILLVVASLIGAGLNILRGWSASKDNFNAKKFTGGMIAAIVAALSAVTVFDISVLGGPVQTVLLGLLVGFGTDFTLSKLKR